MYRYRVASLNKDKNKFSVILIDFIKNKDNQILAISNNKNMVKQFDTFKSAKEYIMLDDSIDFILTDILGVGLDSIFISKTLSKKEKGIIFNNYADCFGVIQKDMYSRGQFPKAGDCFIQDMNTAEYFFFFETLRTSTFALMFGIDTVLKAQGKLILEGL